MLSSHIYHSNTCSLNSSKNYPTKNGDAHNQSLLALQTMVKIWELLEKMNLININLTNKFAIEK